MADEHIPFGKAARSRVCDVHSIPDTSNIVRPLAAQLESRQDRAFFDLCARTATLVIVKLSRRPEKSLAQQILVEGDDSIAAGALRPFANDAVCEISLAMAEGRDRPGKLIR